MGAPSANASGTSTSQDGCYAQWYTTYVAGRCFDTPNSHKQLYLACSGPFGDTHRLGWHVIQGTSNPFDDYECNWGVNSALVEIF